MGKRSVSLGSSRHSDMVNVAVPSDRVSNKALATAGQFRAIALWLNEPLIPQGIYVQVRQDKRPGCLLLCVEYERPPKPERLTRYICHLIWQLNSPLIEGIHLAARPVGQSKTAWQQRVRVMTPALREQLQRSRGREPLMSPMPPAIATKRPRPSKPNLLAGQIKTLRAFMLTGSAVAAFVFGCLAEVLLSPGHEPSLPFESHQPSQTEVQIQDTQPLTSSRLPDVETVFADYEATSDPETVAVAETTMVPYQARPERPNYVHSALEPVGVMEHERLPNPDDPTVTLVFGGDVSLDELPYSKYEEDQQLLAGVAAAYQQADVAMVNLDDSLATADTSLEEKFLNRNRPEAIEFLKAGGVDMINLASDQTFSFGEQGLTETLEVLDSSGIYRVGAGRNEREARRPEILDVKGQRIAYLSYDQSGLHSAHDSVGGVNAADMHIIIEDIRAIRDEVDWLVVNYRWTEAIPTKPADFQTNLARLAIDQGADLVVGHHPTQLQGAEIYKGRPIAYSLGDFVFGQPTEDTTSESAMLQVSLRDRQMKIDMIPVKVEAGQPQRVSGAEASEVLNKIQAASQAFDTPMVESVVLEAHPPQTPVPAELDEQEPFGGEDAAPSEDAFKTDALPSNKRTPDEFLLNVPIEADETYPQLDTIESLPSELLENWGPKEGSGTVYEPKVPNEGTAEPASDEPAIESPLDAPAIDESTLDAPATDEPTMLPPSDSRLWQPRLSKEPRLKETRKSPQLPTIAPKAKPAPSGAASVPNASESDATQTLPADDSLPVAPEAVTPEGAIAPYGEPLVGPLGTIADDSTEVAITPEVVDMMPPELANELPTAVELTAAPQAAAPTSMPDIAKQAIGLSASPVKPIKPSESIEADSLIIDVQMTVIPPESTHD